MSDAQFSFGQDLLEKLIPSARRPVSDITLTMMAPELDMAQKARLKMELQKCWAQCSERIDHRQLSDKTVEVSFAKLTHFIAKSALSEFERQKKLYNQYYTVGLKTRVDDYARQHKAAEKEQQVAIVGWRLSASSISDCRRNGERLLLVSQVQVSFGGRPIDAKTSNISKGGCLLMLAPDAVGDIQVGSDLAVTFSDLAKKYALDVDHIDYQVVDIKAGKEHCRVALRRAEQAAATEFDQLMDDLMVEHKGRNRINVDNTVRTLSARVHTMASIAQLNSLMLLSHKANRYHLLISQGHTLSLQAELQLDEALIPYMVENTPSKRSRMFLVWAYGQQSVYVADPELLEKQQTFATTLKAWFEAPWHKAFLVKSDNVDPQLAELGTSVPSNVSKVAEKINAPLPTKVAQFTKELGRISLLEDLTYVLDDIIPLCTTGIVANSDIEGYRLTGSTGRLRQTPFNVRELPEFYGHYRFSHDCELEHRSMQFTIVNGHADCRQAVLSLPLKSHRLETGNSVKIAWLVDQTRISLDATVVAYDKLHKRATIRWKGEPRMVKQLFQELESLSAFDVAFKEDVQHPRLDVALRNIILSNLPKAAVLAKSRRQSIAMTGMTGSSHLPPCFVDGANRVRLDALFSEAMLAKLAASADRHKDILLVAIEGGRICERRLLSEFASPKLMLKVLTHLYKSARVFCFALDISHSRSAAEDAVIAIENKYLQHYSPGKAKKLEQALAFNLAILLTDISTMFRDFIKCCG